MCVIVCVGEGRWGACPAVVSWSTGRWRSLRVRVSPACRPASPGGLRLYRRGSLRVWMVAQLPTLLPETVQGESLKCIGVFCIPSVQNQCEFVLRRCSGIGWVCVVCWVSPPRPLCPRRWTSPDTWTSATRTASLCALPPSLTTSSCPCPWTETKIRCVFMLAVAPQSKSDATSWKQPLLGS